jgi:hypothetical protein
MGCYEVNCLTHASDKDATGWYPKKPKSNHVLTEVITNQWARINCQDPECEQDVQHTHRVYDPETGPRQYVSSLCQNTECPDNKGSEWHAYQGNSTRGLAEYVADLTNGLAVGRLDEDSLVITPLEKPQFKVVEESQRAERSPA